MDVASGSAGEVAGALAVFAILLALPNAGGGVFLGLAAVGCVVALFVVRLLHRSYVGQLGESLRAGRVSLRPEEALDKTTALTIAQSQVNLDREVLLARAKAHAAGKRDPESSAPIQQATDLQPEAPTEAAPDPTPTWMEELLSGDTERVVRLLKLEVVTTPGASEAHRRKLTGYVIPLLAQEEIASTARKFLSERGSRIVGQLVDELSDPATPASIRSQLAVLLSQTGDPRAMRGVWSCAGDPDFSIRVACVRAAARIAQRDPNLRPETRERIGSELNLDESIWAQQDEAYEPMAWERSFLRPPEPVGPSLEHVFTLLAIEHGRDLMASALAGVHSEDDNLRGTALEYLESVLPAPQCQKLFDRLRESRAQTTQRSRREIEEELLLSQVGLPGRR